MNMPTLRDLEATFDKFNMDGIYSDGRYAQDKITLFPIQDSFCYEILYKSYRGPHIWRPPEEWFIYIFGTLLYINFWQI